MDNGNPFDKGRKMRKLTDLIVQGLALLLVVSLVAVAHAQMEGRRGSTPQAKKTISMDFDQVDIKVFIKFISELTGKNFVVDDKVRGKVTVLSPSKISVEEAYKVFESVLEVHGFTTVPAGKVTKIVPSVEARQKSVELRKAPFFVPRPDEGGPDRTGQDGAPGRQLRYCAGLPAGAQHAEQQRRPGGPGGGRRAYSGVRLRPVYRHGAVPSLGRRLSENL